jgi:hypothetical protein
LRGSRRYWRRGNRPSFPFRAPPARRQRGSYSAMPATICISQSRTPPFPSGDFRTTRPSPDRGRHRGLPSPILLIVTTNKGDDTCPSPKLMCSKDIRRGPSWQGVERDSRRTDQRIRHPAGGLLPDHSYSAVEPIPSYPIVLGLNYSDDLIVLEITFISGRPKEKRLGLLKALNDAVVSAAPISPDDLLITLYETPGENISFGRGLVQRAYVADQEAAAVHAAGS